MERKQLCSLQYFSKSGRQHSGGHDLRPDYSGNPQIAGLIKAKGRGAQPPHLNYKGFQIKRQGGKYEIFIVCDYLCASVCAGALAHSEVLKKTGQQAGRERK